MTKLWSDERNRLAELCVKVNIKSVFPVSDYIIFPGKVLLRAAKGAQKMVF